MIKLFHKSKLKSDDLLTSTLFDERSFYKAFIKDLKKAERSVIIESPFMTKTRTSDLLLALRKLQKRGVKVRVNTRHPRYHDEALYYQAWKAAAVLQGYSVRVRFYHDMRHRKLAIVDDQILWEGSLNILSHKNSRELMRRTESRELCRQMLRFTKMDRILW